MRDRKGNTVRKSRLSKDGSTSNRAQRRGPTMTRREILKWAGKQQEGWSNAQEVLYWQLFGNSDPGLMIASIVGGF